MNPSSFPSAAPPLRELSGRAQFLSDGSGEALPSAAQPDELTDEDGVILPRDVKLRELSDIPAMRQAIYDSALEAAQQLPELSNDKFVLRLRDVRYEGKDYYTPAEEKKAVLTNASLFRRLRGTWELIDKASGRPIASRRMTVAHVPYLTGHGSFIRNGVAYGVINQSRLLPGIFVRRKENGELEAHAATMPGKGFVHRYFLDPESSVFQLQLQQSRMPLLPVLRILGATDDEIRRAWGDELWQANQQARSQDQVLPRLYQKLTRKSPRGVSEEEMRQAVRKAFEKVELDPDVNLRTLGQPFSRITPESVLAVTRKLLSVARNEAETDDRDDLANQAVLSVEDFLKERIVRDASGELRKAFYKITRDGGDLSKMPTAVFNKSIDGLILKSGLGINPEEVNPAEALDRLYRITRLGEGGIACFTGEAEVLTRQGWKKWESITLEDELAVCESGRMGFSRPTRLFVQDYSGYVYGIEAPELAYLVTPEHRFPDPRRGFVTAEEIHRKKMLRIVLAIGPWPGDAPDESVVPAGWQPEDWAGWLGLLAAARQIHVRYDEQGARVRLDGLAVAGRSVAKMRRFLRSCPWAWQLNQRGQLLFRWPEEAGPVPDQPRKVALLLERTLLTAPLSWRQSFLCWSFAPRTRQQQCFLGRDRVLAEIVSRIAVLSGRSIRLKMRRSERQTLYEICLSSRTSLTLEASRRCWFYRRRYEGTVYCASVPGELLLVRYLGHVFWSGNSTEAIPEESRGLMPSHLGMIDPVRTPEKETAGVELFIASGARKGSDNQLYARFRDARTGRVAWMNARQLAGKVVSFPGGLDSGEEYIPGIRSGRIQYVHRDEVDYEPVHFSHAFSPLANLIPLMSTERQHRAVMGGRMLTQAVALVKPEAQLVQNAIPGTQESYARKYGEFLGAVRAKQPGRVLEVTPDYIKLRLADGREQKIDLYRDYIFNRESYLTQTPLVKPGDVVQPGDVLAKSNYTDERGVAALGLNARVAFIPFRSNYEDAIVISRSFADRLKSLHAYQETLDWPVEGQRGLGQFKAIFPKMYQEEQLAKLDERGLIKPGQVVRYGDPLAVALKPTPRTKDKVHKVGSGFWKPHTLEWQHQTEGVVTDVVDSDQGVLVVVRTEEPFEVGDKLCFDGQTEVLTRRGWVSVGDVTLDDQVLSLNPDTQGIEWTRPVRLHRFLHRGRMLLVETADVSLCVTPEHRLWADDGRGFQLQVAAELWGRDFRLSATGRWSAAATGPVQLDGLSLSSADYAWLLGLILSTGRIQRESVLGPAFVVVHPRQWQLAENLENRFIGWGIAFQRRGTEFWIADRRVLEHVRSWLLRSDVRIPRELLERDSETLQALYQGLTAGAVCVSQLPLVWQFRQAGLADDFQELLVRLGRAGKVHFSSGWCVTEWSGEQLLPAVNAAACRGMEFAGPVFCVTLERHHILYVRRDGKPRWCGNSQLYGGKGVVSEIVPDEEMPRDEEGRPFEVLLDPGGLISRGNVSQVYEALLGKIAAKTGKPYVIEDFSRPGKMYDFVVEELRKHGVPGKSFVIDPVTNRKIDNVLTGVMYFIKLHHMSGHKVQGRGLGSYTIEGIPAKSGEDASKRSAAMHTLALLSHGALDFLRDVKLHRGQANDEMWARFMQGYPPGEPKVPLIYEKFLAQLRAAGVNVVPDGPRLHLKAMTDAAVEELAGDREIRNAETVRMGFGADEDFAPIPGGLFDPQLTGGYDGTRWSYIQLDEPLPNPVMEEPIRKLLGLTESELLDILTGRKEWRGGTGPQAILEALKQIDVDKEIEKAREAIRSGRKTHREEAIRRLAFLKAAKKTGVHPSEWMITKVPVLPPRFRPIAKMEGVDLAMVSDPNYLYRALIEARNNLREIRPFVQDVSTEREALYSTLKAVVGLGDPIQRELRERNVKGFFDSVFGRSPKFGMLQYKLIATPVDLVGRAVIIPDPDLDMDHVGLPETKVWNLYRPFIIRRLKSRGMPIQQAVQEWEQRTPRAREAMLEEMSRRPVVIDRAPVLHHLGMLAAWPKITPGHTLRLNPLVTKGFGADFDGNCVTAETEVRLWLEGATLAQRWPEGWARLRELCQQGTARILRQYGSRALELELPIGAWPLIGEPQTTSVPGQQFYPLPPGLIFIWSCDWRRPAEHRSVGYYQVTGLTVDPQHACRRVWTESGRQVGVSDNPSLCVLDEQTGDWIKVAPDEALGRWCPVLQSPPSARAAVKSSRMPVWAPLRDWLAAFRLELQPDADGAVPRIVALDRLTELRSSVTELPSDLRALAERWLTWVAQFEVTWERIVRCESCPDQTVYDFLVPSTQVFALSSGLVVYDTMNFHVPFSDEAVRDAVEKLMASKHLISSADFQSPNATPRQMYLAGLFLATHKAPQDPRSRKPPAIFRNQQDAIRAFLRGEIDPRDPIQILS